MKASRPKSHLLRLADQFALGVSYFSLLALVLRGATGYPYWLMWLGVFAGYAVTAGLTTVWLTLWALRDDGRLGQFSIASLLLLTTFAAIFFGFVRWLDDAMKARYIAGSESHFGRLTILGLFVLLVSTPIAIRFTESLVWLGVWIVHRPSIRRLLEKRHRHREP